MTTINKKLSSAENGVKTKKSLLPLKSDIVFKMFFCDGKNTELLREFLTAMLDLPEEEYDVVEITDPHVRGEYPDEKLGILDVQIKTKNGKKIDVEVQVADTPCMKERITSYTGKMLASQLHAGDYYEQIKKVISLILLDYNLIEDSDSFHNKYMLYDNKTKSLFTDVLEIHTFEMKKLPKRPEPDEKSEKQFLWLSLIGAEREEEIEMLAVKDPVMKKAVGVLKKLSSDERARILYESREKARRDELSRLYGARSEGEAAGLAKGETIGLAKGETIGLAKGETIGLAKGETIGLVKGEAKSKREIAEQMIAHGTDIGLISELTELSKDEIERIIDNS